MGRIDRRKIKCLPLALRENKIMLEDVKFVDCAVKNIKNNELDALAKKVAEACKNKKQVILMMGAHIIRRGNSRFIIDLMERGVITHIATNGAGAIHDFELAFQGATCEDVEFYIKDGRFGNWRETGEFINEAVSWGYKNGLGFGESIGRAYAFEKFFPPIAHKNISIFAAAVRLGVPITVHKGIGYDITDQSPEASFAAIGKTSGDDFLTFAGSVGKLEGGVYICAGSQVMGPEVYLKALSMARNIAAQEGREIKHFTTGVFDIVGLGDWRAGNGEAVNFRNPENIQNANYYFRPLKSILIRTVKDGGESFYVQGDFAETIPAFYKKIISLL